MVSLNHDIVDRSLLTMSTRVQTDMTGGPGRATLTTEESVGGMLETVRAAKPTEDLITLNYNGATIPW